MQEFLSAGIAAYCLFAALPLMAQELPVTVEQPVEKLDELEPVVVVGGYTTPKLWKVSKGDHVMWVLANGGPAPAGVKWRSEQLEARVAESQLVLYPGWVKSGVDIGILKAITLIPAALKAAKNPDKKTLKDLLPPDTYARWRVLKTAYVGRDDDIEKWRPSLAIEMLESEIVKKIRAAQPKQTAQSKPASPSPAGLALRPLIDQVAKKHKVKVRTMPTVEREVKVKNAGEMLKSLRNSDLGDMKCFMQGLEYLESMVEYSKQLANATAQGKAPPRRESCEDFLINGLVSGAIPDTAGILKVFAEMDRQAKLGREQLDAEWMAAAQSALAKNKSTFAMLSMSNVKSPTGYIAKLRELGYQVEEPDAVK